MKRRTSRKKIKYISDNIVIKSEIELTNEQVIKISNIAIELRAAMSDIYANQIAERIYNEIGEPVCGVEVFDKQKKIIVKIKK